VSSVLSTLLAAVNARKADTDMQFVLIIDPIKIRSSSARLMRRIALDTGFHHVLDLSINIDDDTSDAPSNRKQFIRKIKTKPIVNNLYHFLFKWNNYHVDKKNQSRIKRELQSISLDKPSEVYTQPDLNLTQPLINLFPSATFSILEHGIGDYMSYSKNNLNQFSFYCLFPHSFMAYKGDITNCTQIFPRNAFQQFAKRNFSNWFPQIEQYVKASFQNKTLAVVCLQPFEQFLVKDQYWDDFLGACFNKIEEPSSFHWVIKPHPRQSLHVLSQVETLLQKQALNYTIINAPEVFLINIEILYAFIADQTHYLFSPFSSCSYYIPKLYPDSFLTSYYDFKIIKKHYANTPDYYKSWWDIMEKLVLTVFDSELPQVKRLLVED
jgi:hypothetical protein